MQRPIRFILIFLLSWLTISCGNDMVPLLDIEINTIEAGLPGVTILSPSDDEYIETLERNEVLDGSGDPVKDIRGNTLYSIDDKFLELRGAGRRDDQSLITDNAAYTWSSDRDGALGSGATLTLDRQLTPGDHVITLTVTGDYGKVNSSSITVHVPTVYAENFSTTAYADSTASSGVFDTSTQKVHLGPYPDLDPVDRCELTLYSMGSEIALSENKAFIVDGVIISGLSVVSYDTDKSARLLWNLPTLSGSSVNSMASFGPYVYALCDDAINIFRSDTVTFAAMFNSTIVPAIPELSAASRICIDESLPFAYVIGSWQGSGKALIIFSLLIPDDPAKTSDAVISESANKVYVSGDMAAFACGSDGIQLADVSNRAAPVIHDPVSTPSRCNDVSIEDNYLYAACDSGLFIYDISDLSSPDLLSQVSTIGNAYAVDVLENNVYFAIGSLGVGVVDATDPAAPLLETTSTNTGIVGDLRAVKNGDNAYILSSSRSNGFTILSMNHSVMNRVGTWGVAMTDVATYMNYAYMAADDGITIINYADPAHIRYVTRLSNHGAATAVAVFGSTLYAGFSDGDMRAFDISSPENPEELGSLSFPAAVTGIAADSHAAVCAVAGNIIYMTDFSTPGTPAEAGSFDTGSTVDSIVVAGNVLYWAGDEQTGAVYIADPSAPELLGSLGDMGWRYRGISLRNNYTFSAFFDGGSARMVCMTGFPTLPPEPGQLPEPGIESNGDTGLPQTLATAVLGDCLYVTSTDLFSPSTDHYVTAIAIDAGNSIADFTGFNAFQTGDKAERIFTDGTYLFINDLYYGISILEPVRPYADLFNSIDTQTVQSLSISGGISADRARVFSCFNSNDQSMVLELSNDGGDTWFTADNRMLLEFPSYSTPDGTLKWRATMKTANRLVSPELYALKIEYWE